jgi:hypothetical protein
MAKHRKKEGVASRGGCAVIIVITAPLLVLLTTLADQVRSLIG